MKPEGTEEVMKPAYCLLTVDDAWSYIIRVRFPEAFEDIREGIEACHRAAGPSASSTLDYWSVKRLSESAYAYNADPIFEEADGEVEEVLELLYNGSWFTFPGHEDRIGELFARRAYSRIAEMHVDAALSWEVQYGIDNDLTQALPSGLLKSVQDRTSKFPLFPRGA